MTTENLHPLFKDILDGFTKKPIDGNRIIAEFMGYGGGKSDIYNNPPADFHSSWNRLMPVVEKIGAMPFCFNVTISSFDGCVIYDDNYKQTAQGKIFRGTINGTLIQSTWQAVLQFIQWYTQLNKGVSPE